MTDYAFEGPKWAQSASITWSFAGSNYAQDAANPFSSGIGPAYQSIISQAFQAWAVVPGLTFIQTADKPTTDIRIGFANLNTVLTRIIGQTSYRYSGSNLSADAIIRLEDPGQSALQANSSGDITYSSYPTTLFQVAAHEIGHALGLAHSTDTSSIMLPVAGTTNQKLDSSDLLGINTLYPGYPMSSHDPLVDPLYYFQNNPDVLQAMVSPEDHFFSFGWQEGRNPNAFFDTNHYLANNPDVALAHIDPILHYESYGWKEGRDASTAFSTNKYLAAYPDVKAAGLDPLLHYLEFGKAEGRTVFSA